MQDTVVDLQNADVAEQQVTDTPDIVCTSRTLYTLPANTATRLANVIETRATFHLIS